MKLFIIFTIIVVNTYATPTLELLHPSPVNPDVLVALKPEEKIILITDPKEIAKFKRETKQPLYPTALPKNHEQHALKHNQNKSGENSKDKTVLDFSKPQIPPHLLNERAIETQQHKRDIPLSKIEDPLKKISTSENSDGRKIANSKNIHHKRDIPVPLIPKYHHPEESPKDYNEDSEKQHLPPTPENRIQKSHALSAISKDATHFEQQQKRETSSSIPKPESIKENTLGKSYEKTKTESSSDKQATSQEKSTPLGINIYQPYYVDYIQKLKPTQEFKKSEMFPNSHRDQKESTDNKKDENNRIESNTLINSVKAENTSASKPPQGAISYTSSTQYDQKKPDNQIDNLSAPNSFASTTQHPLSRPRPVPVAELFSRAHEKV